jgi:hypothetical protein
MNKLKQTLGSRKFLLALASTVSVGVGLYLGVDPDKVLMFIAPFLLWVAGEFHLDSRGIDANANLEAQRLFVASKAAAVTDPDAAAKAIENLK